jgi:hypothetical protein
VKINPSCTNAYNNMGKKKYINNYYDIEIALSVKKRLKEKC